MTAAQLYRPAGRPLRRRIALLCAAAVIGLSAGGCLKKGADDVTGSISAAAPGSSPETWRAAADEWGKRYDQKPGEKVASLNYARALRMLDQRQQAVAVLETAAIKTPKDTEVLAAYGKALVEVGQFKQAQEVLSRAHTPERPDWKILSAQGAVADQLGDHVGAQSLYNAALKIQPNDPGVLSNLGLSYALARQLPLAEATLRKATDQPGADIRVRQNLSLVLALQGKFGEAEAVARRDLPPVDAAQSVAAVRQMVAQSDTWSKIRAADARAASTKEKTPRSTTAAKATGRPLALGPQPAGDEEPAGN
jgi:Flp pilus assembly protein TadD